MCYGERALLINISDMSLMLWDFTQENPLLQRYEHHTEFVTGVDFNIFIEGRLASCSWDERVFVWNIGRK